MTVQTAAPPERAYLVGLELPRSRFDGEDSLEELATLVAAADAVAVGRMLQQRRSPDPNSWVGKGKAQEIAREVARLRAELVVCDDELKPAQQRSLEELSGVRVVDRSAVILDIFARHARSREGRIQVERTLGVGIGSFRFEYSKKWAPRSLEITLPSGARLKVEGFTNNEIRQLLRLLTAES